MGIRLPRRSQVAMIPFLEGLPTNELQWIFWGAKCWDNLEQDLGYLLPARGSWPYY